MFTFGECLHVYRATTTEDEYGDQSPATEPLVDVIDGCAVEPVSSTTITEAGRTITLNSLNVYAPYCADLRSGDRIQRDNRWWRATGNARRWRSPFTGLEAGSVTTFEMVEG